MAIFGTVEEQVIAHKDYPILCFPPACVAGGPDVRTAVLETKHASNRIGKGACYVMERSIVSRLEAGCLKRACSEF